MVGAFAPYGFLSLWLPFVVLELFSFLNSQWGAGTTTSDQAPLLDSAAEFFLPLAAVVVLFVAVALIYHHMMGRRVVAVLVAGAAGNGRRSISGFVMFALCVSAGTLQFIVFGGHAAGGGAGSGAQARTLGLAALRALPGAATVTFFCGMVLIVAGAAHVAGSEAGGTGAVAGDEPVQGLLSFLTKIAGGAAALVGLMAIALTA